MEENYVVLLKCTWSDFTWNGSGQSTRFGSRRNKSALL